VNLNFKMLRILRMPFHFLLMSTISSLELSLFLFFPFLVVDKSAVAGTMIYMPLISFPARVQEDGEVMEHFPF